MGTWFESKGTRFSYNLHIKVRICIFVKNCERCGKLHDGTFGSGKFCCRGCANARTHTIESKAKTSASLFGRRRVPLTKKLRCERCEKTFDVPWNAYRKTCSSICAKELLSLKAIKRVISGKIRSKSFRCTYVFKDDTIRCDSLMEYACLDWCEKNLNPASMIRSTLVLEYIDDNVKRRYVPDFEILTKDNRHIFVECKSSFVNAILNQKWHKYGHTADLKKVALEEHAATCNASVIWFDANKMHRQFYGFLQLNHPN